MNTNPIDYSEYTILLVDDEMELLAITTHQLRSVGFNVICANDGYEALERMKEIQVDILLIDYFMPGLSGEDVIKEIRKTNSRIVIVLQTGFAGDKPALEILHKLEIQGYHDKTNGFDQLLIWIISCVRTCQQQKKIEKLGVELNKANKTSEELRKNHPFLIERTKLSTKGQLISNVPFWLRYFLSRISCDLDDLEIMIKDFFEKEAPSETDLLSVTNLINSISNFVEEDQTGIIKSAQYLKEKIWYYENTISYGDKSCRDLSDWYLYSITNKFIQFINNEIASVYDSFLEVDSNSLELLENLDFQGDVAVLLQVIYNIVISCAKYISKYSDEKFQATDIDVVSQIGKIYFYCTEEQNPERIDESFIKINIAVRNSEILPEARAAILQACSDGGTGLGFFSSQLLLKARFNGELWTENVTQIAGEQTDGLAFGIKLPFRNC